MRRLSLLIFLLVASAMGLLFMACGGLPPMEKTVPTPKTQSNPLDEFLPPATVTYPDDYDKMDVDHVRTLTTADLVQDCINHPRFLEMSASSYGMEHGFILYVYNRYAVFPELFSRSDAANELTRAFIAYDPGAFDPAWDSAERGAWGLKLFFYQLLISQPSIQVRLTDAQRAALTDDMLEKKKVMSQYPDTYGSWNDMTTDAYVHHLKKEATSTSYVPSLETNTPSVGFDTDASPLLGYVDGFGANAIPYYASIGWIRLTNSISTPRGTQVSDVYDMIDVEFTIDFKNQVDAYYQRQYPCATKSATSTPRYNCHAYAWIVPHFARYWINGSPQQYASDGSYRYRGVVDGSTAGRWNTSKGLIPFNAQVTYGPIGQGIHSAIRLADDRLISKWGAGPMMMHTPYCSPYSANSLAYFTP